MFDLGFGVYYVFEEIVRTVEEGVNVEKAIKTIKTINVDLISSDLNQTAIAVVRGFRILRTLHFFRETEELNTKNYVVWADCGKHFRNQIFIGYLFNELSKEGINGLSTFFFQKFFTFLHF